MIITCENCSTSFNLDEKFLKPSGSKVRCSKCKHVFTAFPAVVSEEQEALQAEAPVEESETSAGVEAAPGMIQESDAALAEEGVQEEQVVDDDQSEELDFDMDVSPEEAAPETVEEAEVEDLDLTGMGTTLDMGAQPAGDAAAETEAVSDDLDLDLDAEPEAVEEAESEEVDLSALDEELGLETEPVEEAAAEAEDAAEEGLLEDLDLDLDMDTEPETVEDAESEELDLSSLDEALGLETEPVEEAAAETEDAAGEDFLEDLDLDLDMDTEPEAGKEAETDELDMSDIKFELGDDAETEAPAEDSELELDLELEPSVGELEDEKEEPDMAGFEETLEMDSPPKPEIDAGGGAEELDLELELDMEGEGETGVEPGSADATATHVEEEIEDLDFELDMEFESDDDLEGAELELESDETEDLDMSDIEQMLEVKDGDIAGDDAIGSDEDKETEVEKWKDTPGDKGSEDDLAEIDLSDLDLDAVSSEDVEIEDQELDFDLDEETIKSAKAIASGQQKLPEEPEELDISQFEDLEVEEKSAAGVLSEGDIELEFEMEGDSTDGVGGDAISDVAEPTQQLETIAMDAPPVIPGKAGDAGAEKPKEKKAKKEKKKKAKKTRAVGKSSSAKPVLAILLLVIIAFGAVVVLDRYVGIEIPYVTEYVKQIPYVNQLMKPDMKNDGEITTSNINSRFVDNETSGRLFVITGTVKNEFSESRRFIQLTGRLFASGKALVKEETVYCGNTPTDIQLVQMELADISKRLSNRFGDNKSNVNVEPGQQLPFMVIFSDFPQDLEEFTIEVVGSSPVQQ